MSPAETIVTVARLQAELNQASVDLLTAVVAVRTENLVRQPTALADDLAFVQIALTHVIQQAQAAIVTAATLYTTSMESAEQPLALVLLPSGD